jgi:TfoX/Sxy family transcriptional regulator of competence genes
MGAAPPETRWRDESPARSDKTTACQVPPTTRVSDLSSELGCEYDRNVAYDEDLADRIRELVGHDGGISEKKMFGGLAFLVGGNMAVAASGEGGILVRVDPAQSDRLVKTTKAEMAVMRGRAMEGWLRVSADDLRTKPQLGKWVGLGTAYARSLPAKR